MTLWSAAQAAQATKGLARGDWNAAGVSIDTRSLRPGDLFVALTAARDGHDFVQQALEAGAAAALVSRVPDGLSRAAPLLIVHDVQHALEDLARAARARSAAQVIAITGSAGKTSTKEMLRMMLATQGRVHASEASYNNHWGVPLTLARMPADAQYAVIEIGMNHPGEIAPLAIMAQPDAALITTVAPAHLAAFDSVDEIAREKADILQGLMPGRGTAILNGDIQSAQILRSAADDLGCARVSFGGVGADYQLMRMESQGDLSVVQAKKHGATETVPMRFELRAQGAHFAMNALGALAICDVIGADVALAIKGLRHWCPARGRGAREIVALHGVNADDAYLELIDDSYNANPASVAAGLASLALGETSPVNEGAASGRKIAFLGDMKELGPQGPDLHGQLADLPAMQGIDQVHCIGPLMAHLYAALPEARRGAQVNSTDEICANLPALIAPGDVILVKGSLSMKLSRIVDAIRIMGHANSRAHGPDAAKITR